MKLPLPLCSATFQSLQVILEQVNSYAFDVVFEVRLPVKILHGEVEHLFVTRIHSRPHVLHVVVRELPLVCAEVRYDTNEFVNFLVHFQ